MYPNAESNLYWESLLTNNPLKYKEAKRAREIILQLNTKKEPKLSEKEISEMWNGLNMRLSEKSKIQSSGNKEKVIPIHSKSTLEKAVNRPTNSYNIFDYFNFRVACVLILAIAFGTLASLLFTGVPISKKNELIMVLEEHKTTPGVKSHLTLSDGSQVVLNSGSELKYLKNFERDRREVFLIGEAFFNVAKDSLRPFTVHTLETTTTALGTSFNVRAYKDETIDVSLLTGKVAVNKVDLMTEPVTLLPGEALQIDTGKNELVKSTFDKELVIGWTKKRIVFHKTPLLEAIRVLENWYGVHIQVLNRPSHKILLSGKFQEETLENVLEGLRFSTRFEFKIDKENVTIKF